MLSRTFNFRYFWPSERKHILAKARPRWQHNNILWHGISLAIDRAETKPLCVLAKAKSAVARNRFGDSGKPVLGRQWSVISTRCHVHSMLDFNRVELRWGPLCFHIPRTLPNMSRQCKLVAD